MKTVEKTCPIIGKTVYKPSDEDSRKNLPHHRDYGLVQLKYPSEPTESLSLEVLKNYLSRWRQDINDAQYAWASLKNFWSVSGRYLARRDCNTSSYNIVIGRPEPKSQSVNGDSWLAGLRAQRGGSSAASKKVFSFKVPEGGRTFGFVSPGLISLDDVRERLQQVWGNDFEPENEILTGEEVLEQILNRGAR